MSLRLLLSCSFSVAFFIKFMYSQTFAILTSQYVIWIDSQWMSVHIWCIRGVHEDFFWRDYYILFFNSSLVGLTVSYSIETSELYLALNLISVRDYSVIFVISETRPKFFNLLPLWAAPPSFSCSFLLLRNGLKLNKCVFLHVFWVGVLFLIPVKYLAFQLYECSRRATNPNSYKIWNLVLPFDYCGLCGIHIQSLMLV